jgi:hypothetical protein
MAGTLGAHGVPHRADVAGALAAGQVRAVLAQVPAGGRAAAAHVIRLAFADGLNEIYLVAGITGLAAGALCLALVRRPAPTGLHQGAVELEGAVGDGGPGEVGDRALAAGDAQVGRPVRR